MHHQRIWIKPKTADATVKGPSKKSIITNNYKNLDLKGTIGNGLFQATANSNDIWPLT
jgi:hypothetical protein